MTARPRRNPSQSHVYLVGSGIASLASAVYLERDAGVPGPNIHVLIKAAKAIAS
jgi:oleate hydratase